MNKRKTILSFILTFVIFLLGIAAYQLLSAEKPASVEQEKPKVTLRKVKLQQLKPERVNRSIKIDGRTKAYEQVVISANVSGVLQETSRVPKEGAYFKKGTLLFAIDQRKARYKLYALRSALLNAISQIMPDLKLDYPAAYANWKKYLDQFEVEKTIASLPNTTNDKEKYFVSARNIYQLYYDIKSAEAQLDDYKIYAPFSGVITQANVYTGATVIPGQPLVTMMNTSQFELEAPVPVRALAFIKKGNKVVLENEFGSATWNAKVARIASQIDPQTQYVILYISVTGNGLKEGMYLEGQINTAPVADVYRIPELAIINQDHVCIVQDSIVDFRQIEIAFSDASGVFTKDLHPEDWIVTEDVRGLDIGEKVHPVFIRDQVHQKIK